jgi:DNA-binding GntR family transcriptional regulator
VLDEVVSEHERIVDALEARDLPAALSALEDHLERSDYTTSSSVTSRQAAEVSR